ncbi:MAG: hypothetical protein IKT10_06225 [Clostridiales bacterium]|nr:hypothetical protein [Clostridiales bacterium]
MNNDNREQQVDQLLRGIYRMCVNRDDCAGCPFYITKCTFEEPKPRTWFDEETITIQAAPEIESVPEEPAAPVVPAAPVAPVVPIAEEAAEKPAEKESEGTWIVSTTMGTAFTKYVFICSKCGYRKESFFSITPITYCPECEKRKAGLI